MPRRPPLNRRLATAARWPVGVALTSWSYLWRTTPMRRFECAGDREIDAPPPLPPGVSHDEIQPPESGAGPLFHRLYRIRIRDTALTPVALMDRVASDPDSVAPTEFASFQQVHGDEPGMDLGHEYVVRMAAPWDGPVRVVRRSPTSFRLATLEGHLEAGQIEFRAGLEDGLLTFEIESWARSADRLVNLLYAHLRMAKEVQFHMWISFLERVAKISGGRRTGLVEAITRHVDDWDAPDDGGGTLRSRRARRALDDLHARRPNFDVGDTSRYTPQNGWHIDDYRQSLPPERPGPPERDGSFATAQRLMRAYEFADPRIVRAVYHPDTPLEHRDMLLELRFWGLRFHVGVRVGGVFEDDREEDGRPVHAWGWSYRTLQGHLEMGQMDYVLRKYLDTGEVEFGIHAFSKAARIANPIVRLGFHLFGRREQVRFARRACERMARLTAAELRGERDVEGVERADTGLAVRPESEAGGAAERAVARRGG